MARYANDPRWIDVRYRGVCSKCHCEVKPGERAFYYPPRRRRSGSKGTLLCDMPACGQAASADFESHAFDEDFGLNAL